MKYIGITPIEKMGEIFVKREDLACWESLEYPSGSKVRQYMAMAANAALASVNGQILKGAAVPCLVGCSANSAMQIYVSAAAKQLGVPGIIYTAQRKVKSDATIYAESLGCEINFVKPGYLSVIRKAARTRIRQLGQVVQWDRNEAIKDTIAQCVNIPKEVKRIIVPTGSGLTAAGVLIGVSRLGLGGWPYQQGPIVVAVLTSPMATKESILKLVDKEPNLCKFQVIGPSTPYDTPVVAELPDGTPCDPFYSAKALQYLTDGDLLWPVGLRPVISMPEICKQQFNNWKGPSNG
jgi:1-aminocyclopropane-1-carboxylate deaminase/D-cysteine desulfhydrase-like pyridoxal-dependent ACC family enzyme